MAEPASDLLDVRVAGPLLEAPNDGLAHASARVVAAWER
ncbi:hypothetical protein GGR75_001512 [Xanthomonas campestris]|nr:hypothetical protein [Xanthomonas campestris]MEC5195054.1 hypothetical protein [Xanthomonas campestris]